MIHDQACRQAAQECANPLRGGNRAERQIVPPGAAHQIGGKTNEAADRRYETDRGLAPALLGDQEDVELGPQRSSDVG
jgi:hypothetical protein